MHSTGNRATDAEEAWDITMIRTSPLYLLDAVGHIECAPPGYVYKISSSANELLLQGSAARCHGLRKVVPWTTSTRRAGGAEAVAVEA